MTPGVIRTMVRIGEQIPDLTFFDPNGAAVMLSALHRGPLLLVFLRHLG